MEDPSLLSPQSVSAFGGAQSTVEWLETRRQTIPRGLLPDALGLDFAQLFRSFFKTSFEVDHLSFGGRLLDSRLATTTPGRPGVIVARAFKHLAASRGIALDEKRCRRMVERASLAEDARVWAYVWELDRRARGKAKGQGVHGLWRSLPREVRTTLDVDRVWAAREALLEAARSWVERAEAEG